MCRDTFSCKDDIRLGNRLDYSMHFLFFTIPRFVGAQFRKALHRARLPSKLSFKEK
jgi:hypothetical protein